MTDDIAARWLEGLPKTDPPDPKRLRLLCKEAENLHYRLRTRAMYGDGRAAVLATRAEARYTRRKQAERMSGKVYRVVLDPPMPSKQKAA